MKRNALKLMLAAGFSLLLKTAPAPAFFSYHNQDSIILLVLDGVRWQDVYGERGSSAKLERTMQRLSPFSVQKGNSEEKSSFKTGGCPMSLPSYQRIFTGFDSSCCDNQCSRVRNRTFAEEMVVNGFASGDQVAVISSWSKIRFAAESGSGRLFSNTGQQPFWLPSSPGNRIFQPLNKRQQANQPHWAHARLDKYTFEFSLQYLRHKQPRFLFIALNDADEWAHRNKREQYHQALRNYDFYIARLFDQLKSMGPYGKNTNVIITTDHGRGPGHRWTDHGPHVKGSENGWLLATGPAIGVNRSEIIKYVNTLADLRMLIESIYYTDDGDLISLGGR